MLEAINIVTHYYKVPGFGVTLVDMAFAWPIAFRASISETPFKGKTKLELTHSMTWRVIPYPVPDITIEK